MATYVLVPGAWLGGWAWNAVAQRLRSRDHDVHPVTLTGLGDRAALASPEVDLERHVDDIVGPIEEADLRDLVLVGHSYGGIPVTGAADTIADRIATVVYVDSGPPLDGAAYLEMMPPPVKEAIERLAAEEGEAGACRCRRGRSSSPSTAPACKGWTRRPGGGFATGPPPSRSERTHSRSH
jgi:pimeloyl-ACP methyl ester carboxylesterase